MQYFIHHNNQQLGPFTEAEVKAKLASGEISSTDHAWWEGQQGWVPLGQTPLAGAPSAPIGPIIPGTPVAAAYQTPATTTPTSQLAIWALVCGCLSLLCGFFASIPAIILGHMGLSKIKQNPGMQGRGMAMAGMILGYVFTVLIIAYLVFVFAFLGANMDKIKAQIQAAQAAQANSANQSTNSSDQTTPATTPDQSTNNTPAATPTDNK